MGSKERGFHPDLVALLAGARPPTDEIPTVATLPGNAAKLVAGRMKKVMPGYKRNRQRLKCLHCGHAAVYNVGMIVFDSETWNQALSSTSAHELNLRRHLIDNSQYTGYFRCEKCNGAEAWEFTSMFFSVGTLGRIMWTKFRPNEGCMFGRMEMHDGTSPQWMSEAEERFLERLKVEPDNSLLWSKLGNVYDRGGRPELAAAVFEHAVGIDVAQVESHHSLANLLHAIGEWELAATHFRKALVYARVYTKIDTMKLRRFLAEGLRKLFDMYRRTKQKIPFLPTEDELAAGGLGDEAFSSRSHFLQDYEFDLRVGDVDSFLPLAEMYMGKLAEELPEEERKLPSVQTLLKARRNSRHSKA